MREADNDEVQPAFAISFLVLLPIPSFRPASHRCRVPYERWAS